MSRQKTVRMRIEPTRAWSGRYRFQALLGERWMYHLGTRATKGWARRIGNAWARRMGLTPKWE